MEYSNVYLLYSPKKLNLNLYPNSIIKRIAVPEILNCMTLVSELEELIEELEEKLYETKGSKCPDCWKTFCKERYNKISE